MAILFDGSGSMWGKLDGDKNPKFVSAREALRTSLGKIKPETRVGLTIYGHRRASDCTDIQVALLPEAGSVDRHLGPTEKLNPKGRGPITAALKEAVKSLQSLPKGNGPRSLVLIHDDLDNCQLDPCSALSELQSAVPNVAIHVIGINVKSEDATKLMCLTGPTKGRHIDVREFDKIPQAVEDVIKLASADAGSGSRSTSPTQAPVAAQRPAVPVPGKAGTAPTAKKDEPPKPIVEARKPLATDGPPAARLAALLAKGQRPLPRDVAWTIMPSTELAAQGQAAILAQGQDISVPLMAGRYEITARDGIVEAKAPLEIADKGETGLDLALGAGLLSVRLPAAATAEGLEATSVAILELDVARGVPKPIALLGGAEFADPARLPAIPAGNYVIRIDTGGPRVDRPTSIAAGQTITVDPALGTGRLRISVATVLPDELPDAAATPASGTGKSQPAAVNPLVVQVFEDDPDAVRGRREIARTALRETEMTFPAGTYVVLARRGAAETRERVIVTAGETSQATLRLNSARVTLASVLGKTVLDAAADALSYKAIRLDVVPPETFTSNRVMPTLELPPGRYRIETRHGSANARTAFEIVLEPGTHQRLTIEQPAGVVRMRYATPAPPLDLTWEIRDAAGTSLWASAQVAPRAVLLAGTYTVRAEARGKRFESRINLKAGDTLAVALGD